TVAVMGTGIDRIYPAAHRDLAHRIVQHGALVSELPLGTGAQRHHFPRRNRLVAGLARRQGAKLVETVQDIADELGGAGPAASARTAP
ncbi:DNA-processing protein DprA, partial [Bordetella pertussis]|uniref:DNA-processing protein DprA n=1 Tax=Bordetella pertussis TaxID=520 RepID=UPI0018A6D99D